MTFLNDPWRYTERKKWRERMWREFTWLFLGTLLIGLGMVLGWLIFKH
jgi:hypothetical protein